MRVNDLGLTHLGRLSGLEVPARRGGDAGKDRRAGFERDLEQALDGLNFSSHAMERLRQRGIVMESKDLKQLAAAVNKAEEKGIRSSLIVASKAALLVNVPKRTVITALPQSALGNASFTNIDGAVFVDEA